MSSHHLNYFKKMLIASAMLGICLIRQMPANAQRITRAQLDRSSIQEVIIFRNEQVRQASIVIASCYQSRYIAKTTCDAQFLQYQNLIANLDIYINQRRVIGR